MKRILTLLLLSSLALSACQSQPIETGEGSEPSVDRDDLLGNPELQIEEDPEDVEEVYTGERMPLFLTTMTHMEGNFNDDEIEFVFERHLEELRYGMDLADEYDAILTIESEKPFSRANTVWGHNMMQEILDRGHGVGTHCDLGANDPIMSAEEFAEQALENKTLVDDLVGAENNTGCSGLGAASDWITAAQLAGFTYINGIVGFHMLAIPYEERPVDWDNKTIRNGAYHYSVPEDILERIYFMQLKDAEDWIDDGEGIVVSNGELGQLAYLEEGSWEVCGAKDVGESCSLNAGDVQSLLETIAYVDENRDPSRVAKLTLYFPVNHWTEDNEDALRHFFSEMQKLQNDGVIEWATQKHAVDTYLELEAS